MIHQLLNLTRPLFVIDCETTGVDTAKDRIVELGFQQWVGEGPCKHCESYETAFKNGLVSRIPECDQCHGSRRVEGMVKEWRTLVNPGVPIPEAVSKVHGITDAMVQACRICGKQAGEFNHEVLEAHREVDLCEFKPIPTFKQLAANLAGGLRDCDFAGKNVRFDLRILAAEFARAAVEWSYIGARIIDAERLEQLAVPRTLSHLHEKYVGHKHDGAHGALSDVRASTTVIVHQLQAHQTLPRDLDHLHALQWPGWIDGDGKFRFVDGVPCFGQWGKYATKPMRAADGGYWDWILGQEFSPEVKALAREAKLGKYPTMNTSVETKE